MHELSIAISILEFVEEESVQRGSGVAAVHVKIGLLSGVVKRALVAAFELARETTPLSTCQLVIEEVPVMIHCVQCQQNRLIPSIQHLCCPHCGHPASNFLQGKELQVVGLELAE